MSTEKTQKSQDGSQRLLVASEGGFRREMQCCPIARTYTAISIRLEATVIIAVECGRWSCQHCGKKKVAKYALRVKEAAPNKLITLTVNPARWGSPREAYDGTRRKVSDLTKVLRKSYGEFEYFRILEVTKKGWPHYHLITRSPYIPQAELSDLWRQLTGAPIVDVRMIKKVGDVYWYVVKYLAKQAYIPWTDRRATWTRGFLVKTDFKADTPLELMEPQFSHEHPADWMRWNLPTTNLIEYSPTCWIFQQPPAVE